MSVSYEEMKPKDDFRTQWPAVDMKFLKELIALNNQICFGKKTQEDFSKFVLANKEKFNNPDYLQIFALRVTISDNTYYKQNYDMCKFFYDFMQQNPDYMKLPFDLKTTLRLSIFDDEFEKIIQTHSSNSKNKE